MKYSRWQSRGLSLGASALRCFVVALVLPAIFLTDQPVRAQYNPYRQIHSFGDVSQMAAHPTAPMIQGSDGKLYGTFYTGGAGDVGGVFRINSDGSSFTVLRAYYTTGGDGQNPADGLLETSVGLLFGTTSDGGANGGGIVFRIGKQGDGYLILHSFPSSANDGQTPYGGLIEGYPGILFGTTSRGGSGSAGTIFQVNIDGTGYQLVHVFHTTDGGGAYPRASLLLGRDGKLYGTTVNGGQSGVGTLFRLDRGGTNFMVLHTFTGTAGDGANPQNALVQGGDGMLYGTTEKGGDNSFGTIFKLNKDGSNYSVIYHFDLASESGVTPESALLEGQDGMLYGTTSSGGPASAGTAFKVNTDGTGFVVLHAFSSANQEAASPQAALIQAGDGTLYGTTTSGGPGGDGTTYRMAANGSQYLVTHNFSATGGDGRFPLASLTLGPDDMLYGTTQQGGIFGNGAAFKLARDGSAYAILHSFVGAPTEGFEPRAALITGPNAQLYGTSYLGGTSNLGTAFKVGTNGNGFVVLHNFPENDLDGTQPAAALLSASDGLLYGTTAGGGSANVGTLFKMDANGGSYAILHQFSAGPADGKYPESALVEGGDGTLFGVTPNGGTFGSGIVYQIYRDGSAFLVLHSFYATNTDGSAPKGPLLIASDGKLYGMTLNGGISGFGTVFRLNQDGLGYSVLHSFTGLNGDAANPDAGLVEGPDGALYGTTYNKGGTVFRLNKDGSGYLVRYDFPTSDTDGAYPVASLLSGNDGLLYGTTQSGGVVGAGSIFRISVDALYNLRSPANGSFTGSFAGTPGFQWTIQRAPAITGPWSPIGSLMLDANGQGRFNYPSAPGSVSFYRMVFP